MQFTLSWWAIPTIATFLFFIIAWAYSSDGPVVQYDFFTPLYDIAKFVLALIASLISWMIYFIIF